MTTPFILTLLALTVIALTLTLKELFTECDHSDYSKCVNELTYDELA